MSDTIILNPAMSPDLIEYIQQQKKKHYEFVKKYTEMNRDKCNKKSSDFYYRHKDKLLEKSICDACGGSYCKKSKASHMKTKKHQSSLKQ